MRKLVISAAIGGLLAAGAAMAQDAPNDTIATIIANGMAIDAQGFELVFEFSDDGTFTSEFIGGTYQADGDELCMDFEGFGESCAEYPAGKTSGDTVEVDLGQGPTTITIQ